jgi:hypothetical protein
MMLNVVDMVYQGPKGDDVQRRCERGPLSRRPSKITWQASPSTPRSGRTPTRQGSSGRGARRRAMDSGQRSFSRWTNTLMTIRSAQAVRARTSMARSRA